MFDLSTFIYDGLMDGIEQGQSRFVITERAASWLTRGVLTSRQAQSVSDALDIRDRTSFEEPAEIPGDYPMVIPEV